MYIIDFLRVFACDEIKTFVILYKNILLSCSVGSVKLNLITGLMSTSKRGSAESSQVVFESALRKRLVYVSVFVGDQY